MKTFVERATALIERGFSVIPLAPGSKTPYLLGPGATSRSRNPQQIQAWAEKYPDANVAIVADEKIAILESDDFERLSQTIKLGTGENFPVTLAACGSSPNRPHLFFKHTAASRNVGCIAVPGLFEARFTNQYVVGPGSIHPDGSAYQFLNDAPIVEIPDWLTSELARLALVQKTERRNPTVQADANGRIAEGGRHYYRFTELGRAWDGKKSEAEMLAIGLALNEQCDPPDAEAKVVSEVRDIMRRTPNDPGPKVILNSTPTAPKEGNIDPDDWRTLFHTYEETITAKPLSFAINGFMQEDGITFFGGLAGHGKTLLMLNCVKSLLEGSPLFGYEGFNVPQPSRRILYLIPESGLRPFVLRLKAFRLLEHVKAGRLFYRTLSKDDTMGRGILSDVRLLRAAEGADVFLDTAVRFMSGDENSVGEHSRIFVELLFKLQKVARLVAGAHHSPKAFESADSVSLESALRGSGDIGAMLATAWAVRQTDREKNRLYVKNVKPRDFEPCPPFELEGRPWIDKTGAFKMTAHPGMARVSTAPKPETWEVIYAAALGFVGSCFSLSTLKPNLASSSCTIRAVCALCRMWVSNAPRAMPNISTPSNNRTSGAELTIAI
jgi:hypothetical protein